MAKCLTPKTVALPVKRGEGGEGRSPVARMERSEMREFQMRYPGFRFAHPGYKHTCGDGADGAFVTA